MALGFAALAFPNETHPFSLLALTGRADRCFDCRRPPSRPPIGRAASRGGTARWANARDWY